MNERYLRLKTRWRGGQWITYYQDRLTGRVFVQHSGRRA